MTISFPGASLILAFTWPTLCTSTWLIRIPAASNLSSGRTRWTTSSGSWPSCSSRPTPTCPFCRSASSIWSERPLISCRMLAQHLVLEWRSYKMVGEKVASVIQSTRLQSLRTSYPNRLILGNGSPRGNGVMDSAAACCAGGPGSIPAVGICKE